MGHEKGKMEVIREVKEKPYVNPRVGDTVKLINDSGPEMVVETSCNDYVSCVWWDQDHTTFLNHRFKTECLKVIKRRKI